MFTSQHGEVAESFDVDDMQKHRKFVQVSKYLKVIQEAPFCWQIINKPHGYAGDSELMGIIYRDGFEGKSPFGRFMNKLAIQTEACQAVRNRKDFLYGQIMDVLSRNGTGTKILSVAAGPVEEIQDVLRNYIGQRVTFLGLDHNMHTIRKPDFFIADSAARVGDFRKSWHDACSEIGKLGLLFHTSGAVASGI